MKFQNKMPIKASQKGFGILELFIAITLTTVVIVWAYSAITRMKTTSDHQVLRRIASSELQGLIDDISLQFRRRQSVGGFIGINTATFLPTGTPCQNLRIHQINTRGGPPIINYTYETRCVTASFITNILGNLPTIHPDLQCPQGQLPQTVVTRPNGTQLRLPHQMTMVTPAMAVCFRVSGDIVKIEAGSVFGGPKRSGVISLQATLSAADRTAGVEYLPP